MTAFGHSILYNYLNVLFAQTRSVSAACALRGLVREVTEQKREIWKISSSLGIASKSPSLELRNVWFRSNPLKELLFTRDKWIYPPERTHTRRWLYFIVHFSRSIVTTVVEKAILRLVASPKTPGRRGHCNIRFFFYRTGRIYTYETRPLNFIEATYWRCRRISLPLVSSFPPSVLQQTEFSTTALFYRTSWARKGRNTPETYYPRESPCGRFTVIVDGTLARSRRKSRVIRQPADIYIYAVYTHWVLSSCIYSRTCMLADDGVW